MRQRTLTILRALAGGVVIGTVVGAFILTSSPPGTSTGQMVGAMIGSLLGALLLAGLAGSIRARAIPAEAMVKPQPRDNRFIVVGILLVIVAALLVTAVLTQ